MKPVDQACLLPGKGDCFAACLASILELPLGAVPNFCVEFEDWEGATQAWLAQRGLRLRLMDDAEPPPGDAHYVVSGLTPGRGSRHSCVGRHGLVVHDPHPDRAGLQFSPSRRPWRYAIEATDK